MITEPSEMAMPEAWRKTGRKATDAHWIGLCAGELAELVVYDDHGRQQGTIVVELTRCEKSEGVEGEIWMTRVKAVQDEYFSWWMSETYVDGEVPVHFCGRRSDHCQVQTAYRHPPHADVFRLIPADSALQLSWLTVEQKQAITQWLKSSGLPEAGPGQVPGPGGGGPGEPAAVETGEPGIRGLAAALGSGGAPKAVAGNASEGAPGHGLKRKKKEDEDDGSYGKGLQQKVAARSPPALGPSALRMTLGKKKKKKKHKEKKSASSESESSDRSDSLFRLAALPAGTEKIHRLHEERPGALANLTLLKFREILERTVGLSRGTADKEEESLPPVARGYLSQILLTRIPEGVAGVRNVRELRTLAAIIDGICQNDAMRSLDIAVQRFKSIEMYMGQGSWEQGNLLELIPHEGEARSYFRPELKATQQELKTEQRLRTPAWSNRRPTWTPRWEAHQEKTGEGAEGDGGGTAKEEKPPSNRPPQKGRKGLGKGKGRKGKFKW